MKKSHPSEQCLKQWINSFFHGRHRLHRNHHRRCATEYQRKLLDAAGYVPATYEIWSQWVWKITRISENICWSTRRHPEMIPREKLFAKIPSRGISDRLVSRTDQQRDERDIELEP